jgi:type IV pilus assembly protein PilA
MIRKERFLMNNRKGFTLVELLAVIVILAIIMIIAIPSVLGTLTTARQKTFVEYVTRVYKAGQEQYLTLQQTDALGSVPNCTALVTPETKTIGGYKYCKSNGGMVYFDIQKGLGLNSTGSYKGWVAVKPATGSSTTTTIYVALYDGNYVTGSAAKPYVNYTASGEPKADTLIADSSTIEGTVAGAIASTATQLAAAE